MEDTLQDRGAQVETLLLSAAHPASRERLPSEGQAVRLRGGSAPQGVVQPDCGCGVFTLRCVSLLAGNTEGLVDAGPRKQLASICLSQQSQIEAVSSLSSLPWPWPWP